MTNKSSSFKNWRLGSIMILTAAASFFLIGMTALVTDVGYLYYSQARLQTAVNAAWKAGYDQMITLKRLSSPVLNDEIKNKVTLHCKEVMGLNGFNADELQEFLVTFTPPSGQFRNNYLRVFARQKVGMFFAKVLKISFSDVVAMRENNLLDGGDGIVPIAIPHGVVADLGNTYSYSKFGPDTGFASGTKYIIRLGTGGKSSVKTKAIKDIFTPDDTASDSEQIDFEMLLVRFEGLTEAQALAAYGAVFWCMRYSNDDVDTYVPVTWLLKNSEHAGGAFLFYNDTAGVVKNLLGSYGVPYTLLSEEEPDTSILSIEYHLAAAGDQIIMLWNRPRVALYTNKTGSAIGALLAAAKIPYGSYGLPLSGFNRSVNYVAANNTTTNDAAVLSGGLGSYNMVIVDSEEDLTGNLNGCDHYALCCEDLFRLKKFVPTTAKGNANAMLAAALMCDYCRQYFRIAQGYDFNIGADDYETNKNKVWSSGGTLAQGGKVLNNATGHWDDVRLNCTFKNRKCLDRKLSNEGYKVGGTTYQNLFYHQLPVAAFPYQTGVTGVICGSGTSKCGIYNSLSTAALAGGHTDSSSQKPQTAVDLTGNTVSIGAANYATWFVNANPAQKMKWAVAAALRNHVATYGHLLAHDFGAETLDMALWQSALSVGSAVPYASSFGFTGFDLRTFPQSTYRYSSINALANANTSFAVSPATELLCQVLNNPVTGSSINSTFNTGVKATDNSMLGTGKLIKGVMSTGASSGEYALLFGGLQNTDSKRLLLNAILKSSFSIKHVTSGNYATIIGKQKSGYGDIDPDNVSGGGVNQWKDNFMFGFSGTIQMEDHIMTDPGKGGLGGNPDPLGFRLYGGTIDGVYYPPNPYVILPIVEPSDYAISQGANTVYDLQSNAHPNGEYTPPADYAGFENTVKVIGFAEFKLIPREEWDAENPDEIARLGTTQVNDDQLRAVFVRYIIKPEA